MLICPQCNFENPDIHKFCQNCGAPLSQKVCSACNTHVDLDAKICHNCGAECGSIWRAIVKKEHTEDMQELATPETSFSWLNSAYLDAQQRYQIIDTLPPFTEISPTTQINLRVMDCQPYQVPPLKVMLESQQDDSPSSVVAGEIPDLAKPYILLQKYTSKGIPIIHDAWQQDSVQTVILEERSQWLSLSDLWQTDSTSSLQMISCFYQMTLLWAILEPFACRQSLLELENLRLDEDQAVALQFLYREPESESLTIQALGRVWQRLFRESQRTQFGAILQLLGELEGGKIETIEQLQLRLQAIATEMQTPPEPVNPIMNNRDRDDVTDILPPKVPAASLQPTLPPESMGTENAKDEFPTIVLPMQLASLENAGITDVGKQRHHNEDFFGTDSQIHKIESPSFRSFQGKGLYILCDGMGGHAGGEVASNLAVNTLREYFQNHWQGDELPSKEIISAGIYQANQAIYNLNQQESRSGVGRMGTTLVMLLIQNTQAAVAHVGDSRLYCLTRKQGLEQLTVDHEVGQREIARGIPPEAAYSRPDAYQLTQAIGPRDDNFIFPDIQFLEIAEDSLFILASDGLSDNDLLESNWHSHLLPLLSSGTNLETGARDLIDLANDYNGHDNITVVLIRAKVRPNMDSKNITEA
ncbi:serine/threonine phosphatase [Calothrix sp. 336/3]|uniref:serine/threonine phosphatase n=1 Tax=Calothrix sp. 336/3 TaxID=1337936 RepID=UPI0004E330E9|nr:serine/threonine phosphatase [Calothrix sp. 336/3]AKG23310.1 serine/threonine protein phosphatase [Calothrix sp. 336/3]